MVRCCRYGLLNTLLFINCYSGILQIRYAFELLRNPLWKRDYDRFGIDEHLVRIGYLFIYLLWKHVEEGLWPIWYWMTIWWELFLFIYENTPYLTIIIALHIIISPITCYVINILNHIFYSSPVECYWWHEKTRRRKLFQDCSPFSCIFIWLVNLLDLVLYYFSYIFLYCGNINLMGQCKSSPTIRSHWLCF